MRSYKLIVPLLVTAAAAAGWTFRASARRPEPAERTPVPSAPALAPAPHGIDQTPRLAELSREIQQPNAASARPETLPTSQPLPAPESPAPDLAAERQRDDEEFEELTFEYEQDAFDPRWARTTSAALKTALEGGPEGAATAEVACRSSACLATITYEKAADAVGYSRRAIELPPGLNCAIRGHLDSAANGEPPRVARILYHDCRDL